MARIQSGLTTTIEQKQRLSMKLQRELAAVLEKSDSELEDDIRSELQENAALEQAGDTDEQERMMNETDDGGTFKETGDELQNNDYWDEDDAPIRARRRNDNDDSDYTLPVATEASLSDYLLEQLNERDLTGRQQLIARWVVGNIDSNGYLLRSAQAIANDIVFNDGEDVEPDEVRRVIDMVRQLDPPGIGAANLRDCILLQLRRHADDPDTALALDVVENHFEAFSNRRFDQLAEQMGLDRATLQRIVDRQIKHNVNPKPGSAYSVGNGDHSQYITPDFDLTVDYGEPRVVSHRQLPRLAVAESYKRASRRDAITSDDKRVQADTRSKVERAEGFIRLLQLRQDTLRRTLQCIVKRQRDYFVNEGDETLLKPMVMQDVADELGVDVSTVSRATTNKYLRMPWGTKPLKFFFHEGVRDRDNGSAVSSYEIKVHLKELIEQEDTRHPLSDQALSDLLSRRGFEIARRTVAKYREQLDIPTAKYRQTF